MFGEGRFQEPETQPGPVAKGANLWSLPVNRTRDPVYLAQCKQCCGYWATAPFAEILVARSVFIMVVMRMTWSVY